VNNQNADLAPGSPIERRGSRINGEIWGNLGKNRRPINWLHTLPNTDGGGGTLAGKEVLVWSQPNAHNPEQN